MRKSQFSFFHELKKCFCHLVLQMKQCFGRISLMCSQKVLHHHERGFVGDEVFWSLKDFWRMKKDLFVFSSQWAFSFEKHFLHTCNWFCPQKKKCIHNSMLLWKTDVKMTVKEDKIIYSKVKSYFRRLFGPFMGKQGNFESFIIFSCLVKWNWSKDFPFDRH